MTFVIDNLVCGRNGTACNLPASATLNAGEALILRGPNGVGKTTMLRTMSGFIPQVSGSAYFGDIAMSDRDAFQENIIYTAHSDAVKPPLTVAENLQFWSDLYAGGDIKDALLAFDLYTLQHRVAATCSAGQKRRLGLARLMVCSRKIWLMDEPTVSLDDKSCSALSYVLQEHMRSGGMAVIATHDTDLVAAQTLNLEAAPPLWHDDPWSDEDFE